MSTLTYKHSYRRKLPHLQPLGASFFITFRLANSLPVEAWKKLRARLDIIVNESDAGPNYSLNRERVWFQEFENYLHNSRHGPLWLMDDRIASLVANDLHHFNGDRYRLDAFSIMPNHVHAVLMPLPTTEKGKEMFLNSFLLEGTDGRLGYLIEEEFGHRQFVPVSFHSLASIAHSLKRHTAVEANRLLGREGSFWQDENYDHYIRDPEEWRRIVKYVLNNPVKAGFVREWREWKWNWVRET